MNNHTADTLKFYLGMEVYIDRGIDSERVILIGKPYTYQNMFYVKRDKDGMFLCSVVAMYPILKTSDQLESHNADALGMTLLNIEQNFSTYADGYGYIYPSPKKIKYLIDNGFGAIPVDEFFEGQEESHTGYVDLFGNPCVTPNQVEEWISQLNQSNSTPFEVQR